MGTPVANRAVKHMMSDEKVYLKLDSGRRSRAQRTYDMSPPVNAQSGVRPFPAIPKSAICFDDAKNGKVAQNGAYGTSLWPFRNVRLLQTRSEITRVCAPLDARLTADQPPTAINWNVDAIYSDILNNVLNSRGDLIRGKRNAGEGSVFQEIIREISGEVGGHGGDNDRYNISHVLTLSDNLQGEIDATRMPDGPRKSESAVHSALTRGQTRQTHTW